MDCHNRPKFDSRDLRWLNISTCIMEEIKYNFWVGVWKTVKNSAVLLVPFLLAVLAGIPAEYAWITSPIAYFLKNWYENRSK